MFLVALAPSGPVFATWLNNKLPQLVSLLPVPQYVQCCNQSAMGRSEPICLPTSSHNNNASACMAPRASAVKEQGFSEAVAARIKAAQSNADQS